MLILCSVSNAQCLQHDIRRQAGKVNVRAECLLESDKNHDFVSCKKDDMHNFANVQKISELCETDKIVTTYGPHIKNPRKKVSPPDPCFKKQMLLNEVISNNLNHWYSFIYCLLIFKFLFSTHPQPKLVSVSRSVMPNSS